MNYGNLDKRYNHLKFRQISSFIDRPPANVLDIGGYTGEFIDYLPMGSKYWVIDQDNEALTKASKRGALTLSIDLNKSNIATIFPFKFDVIILGDILDLVLDPESLIEQCKQLLNDNGTIIVSVTNDNTIYHRLRVLFGKGIRKNPFNQHYHLRHPTFKQSIEFINRYYSFKDIKYWICFDKEQYWLIDKLALFIANLLPNLFARGAVIKYENSLHSK